MFALGYGRRARRRSVSKFFPLRHEYNAPEYFGFAGEQQTNFEHRVNVRFKRVGVLYERYVNTGLGNHVNALKRKINVSISLFVLALRYKYVLYVLYVLYTKDG